MSAAAALLKPGEAPATAATKSPAESMNGAEDFREAVSQKSETAGSVIDTMDRIAISAGSMRISLFDVLVVVTVIVGMIATAYFASKLLHKMLARMTALEDAQRLLAEKLVSLAIWAMAILIGIDILGIDLTAFAFFSGAFGLAIGFGLQKTFGNLIAGIILLMDRSIKPGDVISVADQAGNSTFGQIRRIGIRAVSVTTRDQREYLIPNENLMINQVENWSYSSRNVRMQVEVGISYRCDIAQAEELMLAAARSCKRVLDAPPPTVWLKEYGERSLNFIIHCWIKDPEEGVGNVRSEILKKLWWLFKENDIEIPFPQLDLNLKDSDAIRELIEALGDLKRT
ncbi:MAG TPA: mechanosensitive ion channel domain-containing protein [Novosphingobium sp.]|nr:mechanosensitive ion channel domain-containing protein [Novosphingobium sp.]